MSKNLNETHERILVWAHLSGYSGRDLVSIGNRMIREERIARRAAEIKEELECFDWTKHGKGWLITCRYIPNTAAFRNQPYTRIYVEPADKTDSRYQNYDCYLLDDQDMAVSHGTYTCYGKRWQDAEYPNRIFPDQNKRFYDILRFCWGLNNWKAYKKRRRVLDGDMT